MNKPNGPYNRDNSPTCQKLSQERATALSDLLAHLKPLQRDKFWKIHAQFGDSLSDWEEKEIYNAILLVERTLRLNEANNDD